MQTVFLQFETDCCEGKNTQQVYQQARFPDFFSGGEGLIIDYE